MIQQQQEIVIEPPLYFAKDHLFDLNFHPFQDVVCCAQVSGVVNILKYSSDDVVEIAAFTHHQQSARISQFFRDGQHLITASKDCSFAILDNNGKMVLHQLKAHKHPINALKQLNDSIIATGDDTGNIKIWDLRQNKCVFKVKEAEEAISGIEIDSSNNLLLSSSLDGYLSVHDLRFQSTNEKCLYAKSDCMEEELTDICLVKNGQFVCISTSEGNLLLFKWDYFGDFKDRIIGHPNSIDSICKIDEHSIITGGEDGLVRGVSVFPNMITGILGQHEDNSYFPITKIVVDRTQKIAASLSHDSSIKFYDIADFVNKRKSAKVQVNEAEFEYTNKQTQKEIDMEGESDSDSDDDNDDSDDDDDDEGKQKKQKSLKTKNLQQSIANLKKQKIKQFFDKM
ncbi:unnamed protein product [Paramecium primaurelia]|uniref:WD repeat-containing protein 55 n=1 Tax=Paramecium primaurelia TaxID=5886 RepID=A0A8S1NTZ8_PARPR|nr:unnamed protein product [Paramecium primaurelia]